MSKARTGGRREAVAHLGKAQEFLDAADSANEMGWTNAAASSAVTAGINAKDAMCFLLAGQSVAAENHREAVTELRRLGASTKEAATALDRLLGLKDRAQYDRRDVTKADADAAVRRAHLLVDTVTRLLGEA